MRRQRFLEEFYGIPRGVAFQSLERPGVHSFFLRNENFPRSSGLRRRQ